MLFNKVFAVSALSTLAAATAVERRGGGQDNTQCSGLRCCQQVGSATDPSIITQATSLGVLSVLAGLLASVEVGLNCSPITVIGGDNGACSGGTTVICNDNSHGNLISVGCVPVTI
ncbi:hypothetical protein E1B28_013767 [Marasmius oreades]|uniref:Hydrophobin n=1 Tax=Marasmius oreades TaxID=181124 RepID=A0A9P7UN42_9AGAR|nr:uncharacterized protein E1B28_013767 [Marasmius oreades]KAG7087828.1 hypothetical protein E1B28_013767 [Marasmius oreades]